MKKTMLLLGMVGGSTLTYLIMDKDVRKSIKKSLNNMLEDTTSKVK